MSSCPPSACWEPVDSTHEVETTIIGDESGDLLSVLDELDTDTLSDSGVGLFGLDTDL